MAQPDEQTFPATSGTVVGWLGIGACAVMVGALLVDDPGLAAVRISLALLVVALLVYAFMLRPRIRVRRDALVLVNPLEETVVPFALVSGFEVRQATFVWVGETRYVGVAIGRPLRQVVRGTGNAPGAPPGLGKLAGHDVTPAGRNLTIDMLEERVRSGRRDARDAGGAGEAGARVVRERTWWLIGLIVVAAAGFAVSLLV